MGKGISTKVLAAGAGGIQPKSVIHRYCKTGSYFGLRPIKLANGRLLWPDDSLEQLSRQPQSRRSGRAK